MKTVVGWWEGDKTALPGDTVTLVWHDKDGEEVLITHEIEREMRFTRAVVFEFDEFMGLRNGIGAALGSS